MRLFATLLVAAFLVGPGIAHEAPGREAMIAKVRQRAQDYPGLENDPHFIAAVTAIAAIDRAAFVPKNQRSYAWADRPLPIGHGQTISDPAVVALMTASVATGQGAHIFEVGTGSGYQAAVLSRLGARVHSVEIVTPLARAAAKRLRRLGYDQAFVRAGDGFGGWPEFAPYDGIIVTAGGADVPAPLIAQLRTGGKLVMPIGANQMLLQLILFTKQADGTLTRCSLGPALFVPLTGKGQAREANALYDRSIPLCYRGQVARWPGQPDP